jgi:acyl carrier protein
MRGAKPWNGPARVRGGPCVTSGHRGSEVIVTNGEVLAQVRESLADLFEIEPGRIHMDTLLYDDLEIDSIDAVDLLDRLKRKTGCKFAVEDFRSVRTVGDLVQVVERKLTAA